jgi:hypothetical protein
MRRSPTLSPRPRVGGSIHRHVRRGMPVLDEGVTGNADFWRTRLWICTGTTVAPADTAGTTSAASVRTADATLGGSPRTVPCRGQHGRGTKAA